MCCDPQDTEQEDTGLRSHELQVNENASSSESNKHAWALSQEEFLDWTFIRGLNFNQLETSPHPITTLSLSTFGDGTFALNGKLVLHCTVPAQFPSC